MGWKAPFIARLREGGRSPMFLVRPMVTYDGPTSGYQFRSHGLGNAQHALMGGRAMMASGSRVSPVSWQATSGELVIPLSGPNVAHIHASWTRGILIEVIMGWADLGESEWERIHFGPYKTTRGAPPSYELVLGGPADLLTSRHTLDRDKLRLFGDAFDSTTVSNAWNANSGADLEVASTSSFARETGGASALRCTPTSGDSFLLTWSGTAGAPTRFTGIPAGDVYDTTQLDLDPGNAVAEVKLIEGHVCDVLRKILVSTGQGTNGAYDTLPERWGFGLPRQLIDDGEFDDWEATALGPVYQWSILIEAAQDNPRSWLETLLSSAGLFLAMRQGRWVLRGAQDPATGYRGNAYHIDEDNIAEVLEHAAHNTEQTVIFTKTTITYGTTPSTSSKQITTSRIGSLSAVEEKTRTVAHVFTSTPADDIRDRCAPWDQRISEFLSLRLRGLEFAQACAGDIVPLTTSPERLSGRLEAQRGSGFVQRMVMLTRVKPNWMGASVDVDLLILPTWEQEHP